MRLPTGKGRRNKYNTFEEECGMRRGIITITNKDNLCLVRALVVAMANIEKDVKYKKNRKDTGKVQTEKSYELLKKANVTISTEGGGIPELQKFQNYLKDHRIVVYSFGSKGREVIFEGFSESNKILNLIHHNGHYNVITSLTSAFCCGYSGEECHAPYDHKNKHRCRGTCPSCQQFPKCLQIQVKIKYDGCKQYFRGQVCYNNHLKEGSYDKNNNVRAAIRSCENCFKTVKGNRKHLWRNIL